MNKTLVIAGKDIRSAFVTPLAYVLVAGFVLISGFFFFSLVQRFNEDLAQSAMIPNLNPNLNSWVIEPYFQTIEVVLIFLLPIMTMRSFADERSSTTYEFLCTSPIGICELVWGKFIGAFSTVFVSLLLSFVFPLLLLFMTNPELGPILTGCLGLILFAMAYTALGVAISAWSKSQAVAGVLSLVVFLMIYVIDEPASRVGEMFGSVLQYLSPAHHTEMLYKGVLSSSDITYFLSIVALGIFLGVRKLDSERWG